MTEKYLKPKQALSPAFRKVKPNRTAIESFKSNLIQLIDRINESESEEFHKNLVIDFSKKFYYDPSHFVRNEKISCSISDLYPNLETFKLDESIIY